MSAGVRTCSDSKLRETDTSEAGRIFGGKKNTQVGHEKDNEAKDMFTSSHVYKFKVDVS